MITKCFALSFETITLFGQSVGKTNTKWIPEALSLHLEDLKQSKTGERQTDRQTETDGQTQTDTHRDRDTQTQI